MTLRRNLGPKELIKIITRQLDLLLTQSTRLRYLYNSDLNTCVHLIYQ